MADTAFTGFGTPPVEVPQVSLGEPTPAVVDTTKAPYGADWFSGDSAVVQGQAARTQLEYRPDPTFFESLGAAATQTDAYRMYERLARPAFADKGQFDKNAYLENMDIQLTADERDWFDKLARGIDSANYAYDKIKEKRMADSVGSNNVAAMTLATFADPLWVAIPPVVRIGNMGRLASTAATAATAGAVAVAGEGPRSETEIMTSMAMAGAMGALMYKPGKGMVNADAAFPAKRLEEAAQAVNTKPKVRRTADGKGWEEIPKELQPGVKQTDELAVAQAVEKDLSERGGFGSALEWNVRKQMASFGPVGNKVADTLFDNQGRYDLQSLESHRAITLTELRAYQFNYEDLMRKAMAEDGFGTLQQINPFTARRAYEYQRRIEKDLHLELLSREQAARTNTPRDTSGVNPRITEMADKLDVLHAKALKELQAAGVDGAENLLERAGYHNRRWNAQNIESVLNRMETQGLTRQQAHTKVVSLVAASLRRANGWDNELSHQIGGAIIDRALRKGRFEDAIFNSPAGAGTIKQIRDVLEGYRLSPQQIERALNTMRVQSDDAGKAAFLKHRVDLDYKAVVRVGSDNFAIHDLFDSRLSGIVDNYVQRVATSSAFARKGLRKPSDIDALRSELIESIPDVATRGKAAELFDNSISYWRGDPSGNKMNDTMRAMQSYGRMISLPWSGLWQLTEFATAAAEYGLGNTLKHAIQELPGFKKLVTAPSMEEARSLKNILVNHADANLRLRPFLAKYEDGFELDTSSAFQLSAQQAGQIVPYANGMKFMHKAQGKIVANMIVERVEQAANGNAKAQKALAKYGIEAGVMDKLSSNIKQHGYNVDAWDDRAWDAVRPAFGKMMDEAVLHGRLSDLPAFVAFDNVGKFLFMYRNFTLTAHNKLLVGGAQRNGSAAVAMMLGYQMPLAMLAVQAQSVIKGEGTLDQKAMLKKAFGQLGGIGLFSEPMRWATGDSSNWGSPGLMPVDRAINLTQSVMQGDAHRAASTAMTMVPVFGSIPFWRGMSNAVKEN